MRSATLTFLFLALLTTAPARGAGLYYNLTYLGSDYTLPTDANGYSHQVTASDGTSYAFEKSPVTKSFGERRPLGFYGYQTQITYQTVDRAYDVWLWAEARQSGSPNFFSSGPGWITRDGPADVNIHGQFVGSSGPSWDIAAISQLDGKAMPTEYGILTTDYFGAPPDLPQYSTRESYSYLIPDQKGIGFRLNKAFKIDDAGRILARGSVGEYTNWDDVHYYLLTPSTMPIPQPVPEPSTVLIWGAATAVGLAAIRRRRVTVRVA